MSTVIANISFFGLVEGQSYTVVDTDSKCYRVILNEDTGFEGWVGKGHFKGAMSIDASLDTQPLTFRGYYTLLANHDWFYAFSDSMEVYNNMQERESSLKAIGGRHDFSAYMFSMFCQERNDQILNGSSTRLTIEEMKSAWGSMSVITLGVKK